MEILIGIVSLEDLASLREQWIEPLEYLIKTLNEPTIREK
jgi:hypothetical protein